MSNEMQKKSPWPLAPLTPDVPEGPASGHDAAVMLDAFAGRLRAEAPHVDAARTRARLDALAAACLWCKRFDSFAPEPGQPRSKPDTVRQAEIMFGMVCTSEESE